MTKESRRDAGQAMLQINSRIKLHGQYDDVNKSSYWLLPK